jgi:predicted dehydrogenase
MIRNNSKHSFPLKGAIIGFGNVAIRAHLPIWQKSEHFRVDAVVEPVPKRAELIKDLLPQARVYSRIEPLIAENDLDFVDICTPPCFHGDLMLTACRSGLHVFCEKPLIPSPDDLHQIQKAADEFQKVVFIVNNWKYAPIWTKALQLIHENKIGPVESISLSVLRPPSSGGGASDWRKCAEIAGGGILLDHGWHNLYLILSIMGTLPLSISAQMEYFQTNGSRLEETVNLVMQFPRAEVRLHLTWRASCRQNRGVVRGDQGMLFINDDHLILDSNGSSPVRYDFLEALSGGSHHPEWMLPVVEEFRREILDVKARGANLMEAKWCVRLTQLAYRSNAEGSRCIPVVDGVV